MTLDLFNSSPKHPLSQLPEDDLNLVVQLVLASGSLKALAEVYGVSYPTIRARLDRVIARLRDAVEGREPDPLAELLAELVERGEISVSAARSVRDLARRQAAASARAVRHATPGHAPVGGVP